LTEFYDSGRECFSQYHSNNPLESYNTKNNSLSSYLDTHFPPITKPNVKTVGNIAFLINKCFDSVNLLNPVEQIIKNPELSYDKKGRKLDNILKEFEKSFTEIVSVFYYFNLNVHHHHFSYIMETYWKEADFSVTRLPEDCLYKILNSN
jgi:hypothetical protein